MCGDAGLRKVTDDMKTHKNPALRETPTAKPTPSAKPSIGAKPQPQKAAPAHPPKCALESKKWVVVSIIGVVNDDCHRFISGTLHR